MILYPIGSKVQCSVHKGTLISYFTAVDSRYYRNEPELYGVIELPESYKTVDPVCYVGMLVVHYSNLELQKDINDPSND